MEEEGKKVEEIEESEVKELTPEELAERLDGIQQLEAKLKEEGMQVEGRIASIAYKENFVILPGDDTLLEFSTDVYLVKIEQEDGTVAYQIFSPQQELIAYMTQDGEIEMSQEFLESLDETSKGLLKLEERGKVTLNLEDRKSIRDVEVEYEEKEKEEKEELEEQQEGPASETQKEEIEEDLGIQRGDLAFEADIRDNRFQEIVPEAKEYEGRVKFCRVKGSREVMMIGRSKATGKFQQLQTIGQAQSTNERPIKLDENGQEIQRENLNGIMKYNDRYSFGYTIDAYGELNLELLREDPTIDAGYRYLSAGMETRTQYPINEQVKEVMDHSKNTHVGDEIERYDAIRENYPTEDINLADITDESAKGIIRLSNGETTTFAREAEKAKVTVAEFERVYREADGATPEEKLSNAHDEFDRDFRGPGGGRTRG